MPTNDEKAVALIEAINRLRAVKEHLLAQELPGAADDVALAQHGLRVKLHILQEEGIARDELPRELAFG